MVKDRSRGLGAATRWATGLLASAALLVGSAGTGHAASFLEKNFWLSGPNYSGNVPSCDLPAALSRIQKHFAETESKYWNSSLQIDSFDRIHQIAFRPWGEEYIPRRYCAADVVISGETTAATPYATSQYVGGKVGAPPVMHGTRHRIYYSLVEDGGFLGFSWGVEWCIDGLDRSWTYAPHCRMALP
ncbi:hypothetical protein [Ancylobacter mangrovi]|uniref:Uncharacterized protein n=1 Tax=Ancylobacter mangrovi TaxID=2972472 RepID=A0A9X2PCW4_9HYPH|nr:hypothetical protein [Ancylobacter mangrovi]MCS0493803.1 hypothetical protein [Ancylobacter mangrovi]MCS0501500.1 hypothetical protein [Ancylobacter mangrovi]